MRKSNTDNNYNLQSWSHHSPGSLKLSKPAHASRKKHDLHCSSHSNVSPSSLQGSVTTLRQNTSKVPFSPSARSKSPSTKYGNTQWQSQHQPKTPALPQHSLTQTKGRILLRHESISVDSGDDEMEDTWRSCRSPSQSKNHTQSTMRSMMGSSHGSVKKKTTSMSGSEATDSHSRTTASTATTIRSIDTPPTGFISRSDSTMCSFQTSNEDNNTISSSFVSMKSPQTPSEHGTINDSHRLSTGSLALNELSPDVRSSLMVDLLSPGTMVTKNKNQSPKSSNCATPTTNTPSPVDATMKKVINASRTPPNSSSATSNMAMKRASSAPKLDEHRRRRSKSRPRTQANERFRSVDKTPKNRSSQDKSPKNPIRRSTCVDSSTSISSIGSVRLENSRSRSSSVTPGGSQRKSKSDASPGRLSKRRTDPLGGGHTYHGKSHQDTPPKMLKSLRQRVQDGEASMHDSSSDRSLEVPQRSGLKNVKHHTTPASPGTLTTPLRTFTVPLQNDRQSSDALVYPIRRSRTRVSRSKSLDQETLSPDPASPGAGKREDGPECRRVHSLDHPGSPSRRSRRSSPSHLRDRVRQSRNTSPGSLRSTKKKMEGESSDSSPSPDFRSKKPGAVRTYQQQPPPPPPPMEQETSVTPRMDQSRTKHQQLPLPPPPPIDRETSVTPRMGKARRALPRQQSIHDDIYVPNNSTHDKLVDRLMKLNNRPTLESSSKLLHLSLRQMQYETPNIPDFKDYLHAAHETAPASSFLAFSHDPAETTAPLETETPRPTKVSTPPPVSIDSGRGAISSPSPLMNGKNTGIRGRKTVRNGAIPTTTTTPPVNSYKKNDPPPRRSSMITEGRTLIVPDDDTVCSDITDAVSWGTTPSLEFSKRTLLTMEMEAISEGSTDQAHTSGEPSLRYIFENGRLDDDTTTTRNKLDGNETSVSTLGTLGTTDRRTHLTTRWMPISKVLDAPKTPVRSFDRRDRSKG